MENEQTNFEKIIEFHNAFDLPYCEKLSIENLQNFKILSLRIKLISEELNELKHSKNMTEQLDAIGDLLYVIYGAGASFGINLDLEFDKLYKLKIFNIIKETSSILYEDCDFALRKKQYAKNIHTNFQKVLHINEFATISWWKRINVRSLITNLENKLLELSQNLLLTNYDKIPCILVDMLYSIYNTKYHECYDLDIDNLYAEIHRSNMSKLCSSEKEAIDSVNEYKEKYLDRYPNPTFIKAPDNIHFIIIEQTTGKRLKSKNYSPPKINLNKLFVKLSRFCHFEKFIP
jgi:predicted HAD superfamily Cof-like phosphohydrolase